MPALSVLTLNGLTGADHVFTPYGITPTGIAIWYKPGDAPIGDEKLSIKVNRTPDKVTSMIKLEIPKTEEIDGKTVRTRTGYVNIEFVATSAHTADDRGELLDLARSVLSATDAASVSDSWVFAQPYY